MHLRGNWPQGNLTSIAGPMIPIGKLVGWAVPIKMRPYATYLGA